MYWKQRDPVGLSNSGSSWAAQPKQKFYYLTHIDCDKRLRIHSNFRVGVYYPPLESNFSPIADCPKFWRDKKIKINVLNITNENYIENIQKLAYIGLGINVLVSIACFIIVWRYSRISIAYKNTNGPFFELGGRQILPGFGKVKFVLVKIILVFGWPLVDSILGKTLTAVMTYYRKPLSNY